jgi:hypothetical protein
MRFTAANARQYAALATVRRKELASMPPGSPNTLLPAPYKTRDPNHARAPINTYVLKRRSRVRRQLNLVDRAIEIEASKDEPDGQRLNWLASAQERLAEQERQLDNRPAPGTLRPPSQRITRGNAGQLAAPEIPDQTPGVPRSG